MPPAPPLLPATSTPPFILTESGSTNNAKDVSEQLAHRCDTETWCTKAEKEKQDGRAVVTGFDIKHAKSADIRAKSSDTAFTTGQRPPATT